MEQQQQKPSEYASFWARSVGWLIDALIVAIIQSAFVPVISFGFIQPWYWWTNQFSNEPDVLALWFVGTGILLLILIAGAYFVGFWVWRGQTPGKMAMGIKIVPAKGSSVTAEQALLRYLGYIVCSVLLFIPYLWIAIDSRKQGLQDKFANTYVVRLPHD